MAALVSWLATGLIAYAAVRKYQNGAGVISSILWFCWTELWVGVLALLISEPLGATGEVLVYLGYASLQIYGLTLEERADEFFTRQYGSLTRYKVTYSEGTRGIGLLASRACC